MYEKLLRLECMVELNDDSQQLLNELKQTALNDDPKLVLGVVIDDIETNPNWDREEIIDYIKGYGVEIV